MKKRMAIICLTSLALLTLFSTNLTSKGDVREKETREIEEPVVTPEIEEYVAPNGEDFVLSILSLDKVDMVTEEKYQEAQEKIGKLDKSDKKKWFIEYKKIQEEYSEWIDPDEAIYDCFTEEELDLLFKIVEAEVTGRYYFDSKVNVASVIFNRLYDEDFPDDLIKLLKEKRQFTPYWDGRYKKVEVTETTILAVEYSFQIEDTTNGCLYFDKCNGNSWNARNRKYAFTDEVGHDFYY